MRTKGCTTIPSELCNWITILGESLPPRIVRTCLELLIGAMLSSSGFVTQAWLIIDTQKHWTSYYKCLQTGKWSWLKLARTFVKIALAQIKDDIIYLAIDDTLVLRASAKAPASKIHHQHGNKPNLANYVLGQCWVTLALITARASGQNTAIPLLSRLMPNAGNSGKLRAAEVLIRSTFDLFSGKKVRLLMDSWYMRGDLIGAMLAQEIHVIGQIRIDTRLYFSPEKNTAVKRGRPAKYGAKFTRENIDALPVMEDELLLYGKPQRVRYRSAILLARLLGAKPVHAVWSEFSDGKKGWRKMRLLLSTDITISAKEIIIAYAKRWAIETAFHDLKQSWGLKEAWQQTRRTLSRWVQLTTIGYGLIQLLSLKPANELQWVMAANPWRDARIVTAGKIREGLAIIFRQVNVSSLWNSTCYKFMPPD